MDTDDLSEIAWEIMARAAQVEGWILGVMEIHYKGYRRLQRRNREFEIKIVSISRERSKL